MAKDWVRPWKDARPLVAGSKAVQRARYDLELSGTTVSQERLAISAMGSNRRIVGEIVDRTAPLNVSYELGNDSAAVEAEHHSMKLELRAKRIDGRLVVAGTDLAGAPVVLSEPMPVGAFLALPGASGLLQLSSRLTDMKIGGKRALIALELSYFPRIGLVASRHEVERGPDAAGRRVFNITTVWQGSPTRGKLVVDAAGMVVAQTLDPPGNTILKRRQR